MNIINNFDQNNIYYDQLIGSVNRKKNNIDLYEILVADYVFDGKEVINSNNYGNKAFIVDPNSRKMEIILRIFDDKTNSWRFMGIDHKKIAKKLKIEAELVVELVERGSLELAINANLLPISLCHIYKKINIQLDKLGISENKYKKIINYYKTSLPYFLTIHEPTHNKKNISKLSNTVIYIPEGKRKGLYIKTRSDQTEPLGIGRFNVVRKGIHVDTGKIVALRSGLKNHVSRNEIDINFMFAEIDPEGEFFVSGTPVFHKGAWRRRVADEGYKPKQEKNVDKITFVMELMSGGDLFDRLDEISKSERLSIALHLTKGLMLAHENFLVDLDYKVENIFLDGAVPKMGDFGGVFCQGQLIEGIIGSPGGLSPEFVKLALYGEPFYASPSNQIWLHGCVLAKLFGMWEFDWWTEQDKEISGKVLDKEGLEEAIDDFFPDNAIEGTVDWCIAQCLQYDREDRITAEELIPFLEELFNQASDEHSSTKSGYDLANLTIKVNRVAED